MTLQEARKVLLDDNSDPALWAHAAAKIYVDTPKKDRLSQETLHLLLMCIKRRYGAIGTGVLGLYCWTKRPWPEKYLDHSHDPEEWLAYLKANKFLD